MSGLSGSFRMKSGSEVQRVQGREKSVNEKIENLKYISVNLIAKLCTRKCQIDVQNMWQNMERQGHGGCDGQDAMAMKTTLTTNAVISTDKQGHLEQGQRCECPADHLKGTINLSLYWNLSHV